MKVKEVKELLTMLEDDDEIVVSTFNQSLGKFEDDPNLKFETEERDGKIVVSIW